MSRHKKIFRFPGCLGNKFVSLSVIYGFLYHFIRIYQTYIYSFCARAEALRAP